VGRRYVVQAIAPYLYFRTQHEFWMRIQMILITFDKESLPPSLHSILAHFPRGRPRLATQAVVRQLHILLTPAQSTLTGWHDGDNTCLSYQNQRSKGICVSRLYAQRHQRRGCPSREGLIASCSFTNAILNPPLHRSRERIWIKSGQPSALTRRRKSASGSSSCF
jgi:hypothetical protein